MGLCNNNCRICINDRELSEHFGVEHSDSEPTLTPQKTCKRMISNARLFVYRNHVKKYKKQGLEHCYVKVLSSFPFIHDDFTRAESFEQTIKGIENLVSEGIRVDALVPVVRENMDHLPDISEYMLRLGVQRSFFLCKNPENIRFPMERTGQCGRFGIYEFKEEILTIPIEIKILTTLECNLDCKFCFVKNFPASADPGKEQLYKTVDMTAQSGIKSVRFTGGEPFMHRDFPDVLKYAKNRGLHVMVNSNGILQEKIISCTQFIDDLLISVNDACQKNILDFVGRINIPKKRIATIATKDNIRNLEDFYQAIHSTKDVQWLILRPIPNPANSSPIDSKDVKELIEKMILYNRKYKIKVMIENAIPLCSYDDRKMMRLCIGAGLEDGNSSLVVDCSGDIWPSYFIKETLGNINSSTFAECWNHPVIQKLRSSVPKVCAGCRHIPYCKGGSKFAAIHAGLDIDPLARPSLLTFSQN